jgi:hypothetical protein
MRDGSDFECVTTHTFRNTVATLLDGSGPASARIIADQLGHSRVSMTDDVHLGRRVANARTLAALKSVLWETTYAIMADVSEASDWDEAFNAFDEAVGSPINRVADALEALLERIETGRGL